MVAIDDEGHNNYSDDDQENDSNDYNWRRKKSIYAHVTCSDCKLFGYCLISSLTYIQRNSYSYELIQE